MNLSGSLSLDIWERLGRSDTKKNEKVKRTTNTTNQTEQTCKQSQSNETRICKQSQQLVKIGFNLFTKFNSVNAKMVTQNKYANWNETSTRSGE